MRFHSLASQLGRYALHPGVWPDLLQWLGRRLRTRFTGVDREAERKREERLAATAWCRSRARTPGAALTELDLPAAVIEVATHHREEIDAAAARVETVPFRLGGASNMDLIFTLCEALKATRVVETGVANGWSSLAILLSIAGRPGAALHSVDKPYLKYQNQRWVGIAVPERLRGCWTLHRSADRKGLPKALAALGEIDFAHYDSDKSEAGRLFAYPLMWHALRSGGILFSDDIDDNAGFRKFCESLGAEPVVVSQGDKFQGILRKP